MALNINALRATLNKLNSGGKGQDFLFKPEEGLNTIRIVPLQSNPEDPFQKLMFHFNLGGKTTYLSPLSFGGRDPLAEFSDSLVRAGGLSKEQYKEAKKFYPQTRTYLPVVVRGKEAEGVKFWAFGATVFKQLVEIMTNTEDYGDDITDVNVGHDIRVTFVPAEKSPTGFAQTSIMPVPKQSKLTTDPKLLNRLLNEQTVLTEAVGKPASYDELNTLLQAIIAAPSAEDIQEPAVETIAPTTVKSGGKTEKVAVDVDAEFDAVFQALAE